METDGALVFTVESEASLLKTLGSIAAGGQGWSARTYSIWATTSDGARFELKSLAGWDQSDAEYTRYAYQQQAVAAGSLTEWARSKGFDELASHLQVIASS